MITMKRALIATLLVVGVLAGSYQLYAGNGPEAISGGCCPEGSAECRPCDTPCCES